MESGLENVENRTQSENIEDKYLIKDDDLTIEQERILSGAQLSEEREFRDKNGTTVTVTPVLLDFRRILQSKSSVEVVPGVPNEELLHSVIGLYNTSLSEMTPDVLYTSVCDKRARTIILLQSVADAVGEYNARKKDATDGNGENPSLDEDKEDSYTVEGSTPGFFAGVFSDQDTGYSESEEDGEDDSEEEDDYSRGVRTFLRNAHRRRHDINSAKEPLTMKHIGIEHRIVGVATYEKTYCKPGEKIIHLTLITVRKKFRKAGIGKYLLFVSITTAYGHYVTQIRDMSIVGHYDAVVVHADNSALEFFQRYGFTDDIILNSRWSDLAEQYTNCTLMCYLPPFTNKILSDHSIPELDIIAMDNEIKKWREKSLEAYRSEITCVSRMRHEVVHLRALVSSQQDLITILTENNEKLRHEKFLIEKEFLEYRLTTTKEAFTTGYSDDDDEIPGEKLIRELEREVSRTKLTLSTSRKKGEPNYLLNQGSADEPYDHGKDTQEFYKVTHDFDEALKVDNLQTSQYQVQMVSKAILPASYTESYRSRLSSLNDPTFVTRLYFCGSLKKPDRLPEILHNGFSEQDMIHGEYGRGLYFSKYPLKAALYAPLGSLILTEVALGTTETVVTKDRARTSPSKYSDSIITPGRHCSDDDDQLLCQEYVVFDIYQTLPLYLISYSPTESRTVPQSPSSAKPKSL
ncbi:hypothetical protein LSH36_713g01000 [Paralvinella palmiformis]|uniref:N-acetyltransferase domain-containing protein n=1 Tax=Paralvinella palmiformis TaxID=53620 RepID=A0AAD9J2U3_9ANNE|nr:hypothetical protein LSH36_713g01000 [Paralvinella palmiformis]